MDGVRFHPCASVSEIRPSGAKERPTLPLRDQSPGSSARRAPDRKISTQDQSAQHRARPALRLIPVATVSAMCPPLAGSRAASAAARLSVTRSGTRIGRCDLAARAGTLASPRWNLSSLRTFMWANQEENKMGRGLLLWLIGIPIPIILLIWLFGGLH